MEPTKFLKLVIVMLLLINLGTLSFIWMGRATNDRHRDYFEHPEGPAFFLEDQLKLNSDQKARYKIMRDHHHGQMVGLREKANGFREQLNKQLGVTTVDSAIVVQLSDSIGNCQQQAEAVTMYHFRELREICSEEQQIKFDQVISEAMRMLSRQK